MKKISCLELDIDADTPAAKLTAVRKWLNHTLRQVTNSDLRSIAEQMTKHVNIRQLMKNTEWKGNVMNLKTELNDSAK